MPALRIKRRALRAGTASVARKRQAGSGADAAVSAAITEIEGVAKLGRRTKQLISRLGERDVAIIDHEDLDRVCAEDLVTARVRCVVNVARSSSGRYPNAGPLVLAEAGVHLVDVPGAPLFAVLKDGDRVLVRGGRIERDGELIAEGEVQDLESVARAHEERRREIGEALEAFARNTMTHILEERELLAGKIDLPELRTSFRDRPALVVVRGAGHQRDLRMLRPYVRDVRPVLVAVDGGADAILEEGFRPDLIVGDMDSASDAALRSGAELVVHAYPDGRAPGRARLDQLGLAYRVVPAPATSEDVAMLIAAEKGAELIVTVGAHFNLVEFLDKNRHGMSSTFLTRLRIGEILVDAKGVSRLYRPSAGGGPLVVVVLAALATLAIVIAAAPARGAMLDLIDLLWLKLQVLVGLE